MSTEMALEHLPVLAAELAAMVDAQPGETVVDATFGAGGHARLLAQAIGADGTLIAIDRDPQARERFEPFADEVDCATRFIPGAFAAGLQDLLQAGQHVDVLVLDLGVSSFQIDTPQRGFSYIHDAPLDMRMDPSCGLSAAELVAEWDERRLRSVFREYGEERYAGQIARAIVRERDREPIATTTRLVEVLTAAVPAPARFAAGHPAKRVFQALRIAVNDELGELDAGLEAGWELLAENGRFAGISSTALKTVV